MSRGEESRSAASPGTRRSGYASGAPLPPAFYARAAADVAVDLLGCILVSSVGGVQCRAEIVETEAYTGPGDEASHAHERIGRTQRNAAMFGLPGIAYVYRIYGIHWCLNAVTGAESYPAAVLVRAGRPLTGREEMRLRRPGRSDTELLRGPGNLCRGLGVTGAQNAHALQEPPLWIEAPERRAVLEVCSGPRIGISRATTLPLRFWLAGSPYVSR